MYLILNNLQRLICQKTQTNKQTNSIRCVQTKELKKFSLFVCLSVCLSVSLSIYIYKCVCVCVCVCECVCVLKPDSALNNPQRLICCKTLTNSFLVETMLTSNFFSVFRSRTLPCRPIAKCFRNNHCIAMMMSLVENK